MFKDVTKEIIIPPNIMSRYNVTFYIKEVLSPFVGLVDGY